MGRQIESDNGPAMRTQDFEGPFRGSEEAYQLNLPTIDGKRDSIQS